ncbi:MAG: ATP-binding protein [Oligoflexia bacterium]|nr:ATP-binding protein [Oligoflexia bacterium]
MKTGNMKIWPIFLVVITLHLLTAANVNATKEKIDEIKRVDPVAISAFGFSDYEVVKFLKDNKFDLPQFWEDQIEKYQLEDMLFSTNNEEDSVDSEKLTNFQKELNFNMRKVLKNIRKKIKAEFDKMIELGEVRDVKIPVPSKYVSNHENTVEIIKEMVDLNVWSNKKTFEINNKAYLKQMRDALLNYYSADNLLARIKKGDNSYLSRPLTPMFFIENRINNTNRLDVMAPTQLNQTKHSLFKGEEEYFEQMKNLDKDKSKDKSKGTSIIGKVWDKITNIGTNLLPKSLSLPSARSMFMGGMGILLLTNHGFGVYAKGVNLNQNNDEQSNKYSLVKYLSPSLIRMQSFFCPLSNINNSDSSKRSEIEELLKFDRYFEEAKKNIKNKYAGADDVIEYIFGHIKNMVLNPESVDNLVVIPLVGSPGTAKTSLVMDIVKELQMWDVARYHPIKPGMKTIPVDEILEVGEDEDAVKKISKLTVDEKSSTPLRELMKQRIQGLFLLDEIQNLGPTANDMKRRKDRTDGYESGYATGQDKRQREEKKEDKITNEKNVQGERDWERGEREKRERENIEKFYGEDYAIGYFKGLHDGYNKLPKNPQKFNGNTDEMQNTFSRLWDVLGFGTLKEDSDGGGVTLKEFKNSLYEVSNSYYENYYKNKELDKKISDLEAKIEEKKSKNKSTEKSDIENDPQLKRWINEKNENVNQQMSLEIPLKESLKKIDSLFNTAKERFSGLVSEYKSTQEMIDKLIEKGPTSFRVQIDKIKLAQGKTKYFKRIILVLTGNPTNILDKANARFAKIEKENAIDADEYSRVVAEEATSEAISEFITSIFGTLTPQLKSRISYDKFFQFFKKPLNKKEWQELTDKILNKFASDYSKKLQDIGIEGKITFDNSVKEMLFQNILAPRQGPRSAIPTATGIMKESLEQLKIFVTKESSKNDINDISENVKKGNLKDILVHYDQNEGTIVFTDSNKQSILKVKSIFTNKDEQNKGDFKDGSQEQLDAYNLLGHIYIGSLVHGSLPLNKIEKINSIEKISDLGKFWPQRKVNFYREKYRNLLATMGAYAVTQEHLKEAFYNEKSEWFQNHVIKEINSTKESIEKNRNINRNLYKLKKNIKGNNKDNNKDGVIPLSEILPKDLAEDSFFQFLDNGQVDDAIGYLQKKSRELIVGQEVLMSEMVKTLLEKRELTPEVLKYLFKKYFNTGEKEFIKEIINHTNNEDLLIPINLRIRLNLSKEQLKDMKIESFISRPTISFKQLLDTKLSSKQITDIIGWIIESKMTKMSSNCYFDRLLELATNTKGVYSFAIDKGLDVVFKNNLLEKVISNKDLQLQSIDQTYNPFLMKEELLPQDMYKLDQKFSNLIRVNKNGEVDFKNTGFAGIKERLSLGIGVATQILAGVMLLQHINVIMPNMNNRQAR